MVGLSAVMFREYKLLVKNRINLVLGLVPPAVYILLFATSITNIIASVSYRGQTVAYADFIIPAVMLMSMIAGATTTATSIFQEEAGGMTLEIWSYPLSKISYILGKLIATTAFVLLQGLVMLIVAAIVFGHAWPVGNMFALLIGIVCTSVALNGLYLYIATLFKDQQRFMIAINVAAPILIFGSPSFYPPERMPSPLQTFSWLNPVTYGINSLRNGLLFGLVTAWQPIALLLVLAIITSILTSRSLLARFQNL